jgi:anti-anti-sigma regulatory factor/HAMP domain-containing protein
VSQGQADAQASPKTARFRLTTKVLLLTGGLWVVLAFGVAALTFAQVQKTTLIELEHEGAAIATTLSYAFEGLLDRQGIGEIQRIAANSATLHAVDKVIFVDLNGQVLASSDRLELNEKVSSPWMQEFLYRARWEAVLHQSEDTVIVIEPLHSDQFEGVSDYGVVGAVQVNLNRRSGRSAAFRAALRVLGASVGSSVLFSVLLVLVIRALVVRPLHRLESTAQRFREGERSLRSQIRTQDELGMVSLAFDEMAHEVEASMGKMAEEVAARTAALEERTRALDELRASTDERLKLAETIRELSTPVIRVHPRIIVMPLIGSIDTARAAQIAVSLLEGIQAHQARKVILDLTGVPVVDTQVAAWLLQAKQAAEFLGSDVLFVGISPQVAQSIVHLGIEFPAFVAHHDLESGLMHALHSLNLEIRPMH